MVADIVQLSDVRDKMKLDGIEYCFAGDDNYYFIAESMYHMIMVIRNPMASDDEKLRMTYNLRSLLVRCEQDRMY